MTNHAVIQKTIEGDRKIPSAEPKATIIVAEDDIFFRELICDILKSEGYWVAAFSGGNAALKAASQLNADIMITDLIMDEGEGISTIIELRRLQMHMKILAVSANKKYLTYAQKSGADCIMAKPITSHELLEKVRLLLPADRKPSH